MLNSEYSSQHQCPLPYFGKLPSNMHSTGTPMAKNLSSGRLQQCRDGNGTIRLVSPNKGPAEHITGLHKLMEQICTEFKIP